VVDGIRSPGREPGAAGHGDVVPDVYGPEDGTRFRGAERSMHHGTNITGFATSTAAKAAGVIQPRELCG
jgi:hypothetical protein